MATANESPQPLPVPAPHIKQFDRNMLEESRWLSLLQVRGSLENFSSSEPKPPPHPDLITAVDEKDLITNVPESSYLLEDLKKAGAEINGTSETIESPKIAVILHVPTDPVLETLNNASEVHVAKEGESFLVPPSIAKLEKEETAREQDYSVIVESSSMAVKEITDDQTQKMLKKQEEEEEISNSEIITTEEIKENVEKEQGLNIPEGFDTIQTKSEESIPEVGEESQKEEPLSQGTEIIVNKEAFYEERAQNVEELCFPKEDNPDETKADESVAEEKPLTEVTAEVSSHASLVVKVETEEALDKEEENSRLVIDKGIVTESQREAEDQTELVDQSIELEESLDDHVLTTTENSSLIKEEISTATEEQKEETIEVKEVEERKEKDIPAVEEPKESSSQDDDPEIQTLDESLHVSSKNVETTYSSEIVKIQELSTEGKDEVIPPVDSDEKAEGEEVRAGDDSHLTHAPIEETETGGKLQEEIQEEEFFNSAPRVETKFNDELSALGHPTNLGESSNLVDGDDLESNAGKESEKPVDQETSIPLETSTERNVMELEHKESSDKLETNEIVSSNLETEHNEEPSKQELEEVIKDTDDVLIQQAHEGSDRNENHEEQTTQEESYKKGLREASAEDVVTEAETSPTIPTEEVVQKHITHEESSSTEIAPSAIVVETIQSSEEVEEDNNMERAEEVQTCVPTEADTAESTSEPEVTEMPEKDQTREFFVHSHISKENIENVEAVNPVLEEKSEANKDDTSTNEASSEVAVNEKIEGVDSQEESASTEIISLENDTVQKVRDSKPDSLSLENAEIIKDEQVSQSDPEIIEELEEVTTGSVAVQESDAKQIIEDKPEEMETKKDLEELTTESTKEQLEVLQINKDEPTAAQISSLKLPYTAHSQEIETIKEELEEVTPKLEEEPQSEATKIATTEQALQSTEPECKDEEIEEETTESGHKQQVEEIMISEPIAELEEAKKEVVEEVKTDSAEEQQVEAIQIITNDQIPESEEAKEVEIEEVTTAPAEEQQSQAIQIITQERSFQPKEDSEEIITELAQEQQEKVIIENELIPQSEAESVKEPESEATQAITHDQVAQSEEREIKKEDLVEGVIRPAEEAIIENELIPQAEEANKELQEVTANPEGEPQSEATAGEAKKEKLEEVTTNPAKESQSEATHAMDCEQVAQSEELDIRKKNLEEGTIEPAEEVAAESAKEIESESAKEQQVKAIQIIRNDRIPESEEAKKEEIEGLTEEEQQSQSSQIITRDRFIQPEELEIKIDPEETTKELVQEQQEEVINENELIPQLEEAKKEEIEEVTAESAKEPKSEATQAVTHEQVAQSEEWEIKKEDLVEGAISLAEEEQVEAIRENELIYRAEEAKKEELQEVAENPEGEPQSEAAAGEAKKEKLEEVTTEPAKEPQSGATHVMDCDQVAQSEELDIRKENLEEGTIESAEEVAAESERETKFEVGQAVIHEQVPQSGQLEMKKEDIEEGTIEPAEEVAAESARETEPKASQPVSHEQVPQSGQLETKKEDIEEGIIEPAEEVAVESARETESEASQAIAHEKVAQSGQLETKKEDFEKDTIEPGEELQLQANIQNELISQSEETKDEPQSEAIPSISHEQVAQSEDTERKKENLEEGTIETVGEDHQETIQVIENEPTAQSEEIKKDELQEVATKSVEERDREVVPIITREQVAQSEELENEHPGEARTESAKEQQVEAVQIIKSESTDQSAETKNELDGIRTETEEQQSLEFVQMIREVAPSEVLQTKKGEVEEVTTDSAEEQKIEAIYMIKDVLIAQLEEDKKEEHEEVPTQSVDELQTEAVQIISCEQVVQSEQQDTKEDLEAKEYDEVATELAEGHQSEAIQIVKEQVGQSDELETEIKGAEIVTTESADEPKYEENLSIKNDQATQSVDPQSKIEDLAAGTTGLAEEQLLGTVQINKNEEATRVEEPTTKTEDLVEPPTPSTEDEQFEARAITKKEISVEESAGGKEAVQPEEIANEIQQTDDIKPNGFPNKQVDKPSETIEDEISNNILTTTVHEDVNQQTGGAEKVDTTEFRKEEVEQTERAEKVDTIEFLKEEVEQNEGAEKVDATESLKEEFGQIDNETSKHPLLHDDEIVPKVQNSEPILSETEKGQSENDEILSEQQREAPLPRATEAEPEKKEDEEKPEEISVVICDDLEEGPEVETIQQVDNLPKEIATELSTSESQQSLSEVKDAQSDTLGVSQGDALLELELGTESTSFMPSEQPPQDVLETERSLDYLEEVDHQLEKAHETALKVHEQVAQPEVEKENPEEVIIKSIQEPTEGTQITKNEAMEEISQDKEMVSDSHQGSPEEENTHVIQPNEERVIINEEEVHTNLEKKVSVITLEEKAPEGFGEVVGREIFKEEIMPEEKGGDARIKEVEVSEETSKEILELAKVNDEKEAAELKNDEEVSDLQKASSLSDNPQPNLNNETGEEKPQDVDVLKSDEPEEIVKLKTAEQPTIESNENETKDSESEAHKSSQPMQTESAHTSSLDVCQNEEILDSKDDDNSPREQLPGAVIETKISEDNLEVQSRGEIPENADSEEKKENPEEVITESIQEEQIESFSQTTQNSVEEHELEKEVITEPRKVTLSEQITKELHEEEPKEEEMDSGTKIEEELRMSDTSQDRSELTKEKNTNDGLQSPEKEAVEEDLEKTEEEIKTAGSSADSGKQEVQTSDFLTPVAKEDKGILPEEFVSEKVLKDKVTDRDMDFKDVKVAHVSEELELKVSNDSAEEKAAVLEEESSAKELLQEEINESSVANLVVSEELDKETVTKSLKNEESSGNDTEENDSDKPEEKGDFLVQEEDEKDVAIITKPLSEEELLKTDSSKAVDATSKKAETNSEDAETPSSGQPGLEMSVQEEEKREVETTQVVVDAIPDGKNEEPLAILSSKEELTEADSRNETVEMSKKGTGLFEDTQKEVPEKERPKELDIQNFHESRVKSDEMVETTADSLLPKQASQELEGSEEVDGRKTLEKETRQEESATTELLGVNADNESNKEVRAIDPVSVEALKPIEFNSETEMSKLENYEDLSDKQEVSTLSEEPKSQPDEIADEKLEGPVKKAEDVQKEIETHGLESNPQGNISAPALTIANAGAQNVVEGTSTPTSLDDSQDQEILYVGNVKGNVSSVTSELPTAVIETEITKDSVEDTILQSGFAEKTQGIAPQIMIHEEVSQLESAEIKKDDIEEVTTKSVEEEQIEAIPVMINDSNLVEEIVEKEEFTESHQVSPHEETLKEVKETDELKAEQTVMQFSEETGKAGTRDYVEEEITQEERALKDQLEADAEDKKTYVFIDDERQDISEEDAKLNLENKDSLPKLEAEVQLPEITLGTKDERETFISSDEVKPQTELGVRTAKLTAEEENASSKAGDGNIGNGTSKAADEKKQPPAEVVGNPEKHPDHEKDASTPLKTEGEEFGIKFGVDEKGKEPCIKEPGDAIVDERCPEEMPEKSSQYVEPKPEFDFGKMGIKISNTDTYKNMADETQRNKAEEQGELLATERAWKLEETPDAASLENPKGVSAKPVQESTAEGEQKAENFSDKDHTHCKETAQKDLEDEGEEHKREDSGSDGPVFVEASKDTEVNRASPHKKHHNILSGVGSKVKHSISKVKKAITGKSSSHLKSESPK